MARPGPTPFQWLWTASSSGALGDGITLSVLPLLMASLTRDPMIIASLQVAAALPWILFGLQAGALVDRWDRARVLMAADLARGTLVTALGVLVVVHAVSVAALLVFAVASTIAGILFRSAYVAVLPTLVPHDRLARANSQLKTGETITGTFIGPSLGSTTFTIAPWLPILGQAMAFAASVVCLWRLPRRAEPRTSSGLRLRTEIRQGLHHVWTDSVLRTIAIATLLQGAATSMLLAVLVLYTLQTLHAPAASYGFLITIYAIGSLGGATVTATILARAGTRRSLVFAGLAAGVSVAVLAMTHDFVIAAAGMAVFGVAAMVIGITEITVRQQRTPEHLLGRVSSAFNVLNVTPALVGAPIAGIIANTLGIAAALGTSAAIYVAAALILLAIPPTTSANHDVQGQTGPAVSDE